MRILLFAFLIAAQLTAQNTSGSISGTVKDAAGAVVPNAKVTLTGQQNGFVRTVTTNKEGFFNYPDLTPATFTMKVEATGFKTYSKTEIVYSVNRRLSQPTH